MMVWIKDSVWRVQMQRRGAGDTNGDEETPNEIMDQGNDHQGLLRTLGKRMLRNLCNGL